MRPLGAGRVPLAVTIILGLLTAVGPFSLDAYLPAFPTIAFDLDATTQHVQLSLTACLLGLALGQLVVGPLGDRVGRRWPLLLGSLGYVVASLACAITPSIELFTLARFVQGFAGAAGLVMARAVVRDLAAGRAAITLYSQLAVVAGIAPVIAPVLGAVALEYVSWRGVFVGLAVLGAVLTALVATMLPETHHPEFRTNGGMRSTLIAFGTMLRNKAFAGYVLLGGLSSTFLFSYIASSSFVVQDLYDGTSAEFAMVFAANGLGIALFGQLNGRLAYRHGAVAMLRIGVLAQTVGVILLLLYVVLRVDLGEYTLLGLGTVLFLSIAPLGFVFPNTMAIAMGESSGHSGTASALLGVTTFLFGAIITPISALGDAAMTMVIIMAAASIAGLILAQVLRKGVTLAEE